MFLLAKVMGWSIALSGASSYLQPRSSLTCSNVVPWLTPGACVSRYNGLLTLKDFMHMSSFTSDLDLSHISWYDIFQA